MVVSKKRGLSLATLSEQFRCRDDCEKFLAELRWPQGVSCPRCESRSVSKIATRRVWDCSMCGYQFSVTSGTIFHKTRLPLQKWILATALICNAKKGISAKQIERDLSVTYKTAWYLMHRIRRAMKEQGFLRRFKGIVEVDDAYIGGKGSGVRGRGSPTKKIVVGVRERGGAVRAEYVKDMTAESVCSVVRRYVDPKTKMLITDEYPSYNQLSKDYRPERINHSVEYVRGQVHTNSIESFWNVLKRGISGSYHKISVKYLPLYLNEFTFRFSHTRNGNGVGLWKDVLANAVVTNGHRTNKVRHPDSAG